MVNLNALSAEEAEKELLTCCASRAFAREVVAGRPYAGLAELTSAAEAAVRALAWPDVEEALAAHPRIGERPAGSARESEWSRQEQSGVADGDDRVRTELAEGNRAYERRFGHVYLICATGLSGEEMLARLKERLDNDEDTERAVVRDELAKITKLRLARI
ncbi:2-oxo-4-hydroxy-4-carboxy-5-ureidoimidazoline decarboxylase [Nonomuraea africana]|uniref:2-oxo-4-hydroxy-4-carboxy-5-ureidoimidazoline decarboxylase n=1 Tax=Nonomuraea africana TaxID=46171 RepID=A0ABR9KHQ5_9ACTN|nr:2-oxo-4-hydroxy-4-carboxy-5-ureidoimidazoline decarboxylase [Nonomuraea africana]MBE1561541.1 2-oxo-4-hydroxy-4-carboxy-5-ureidoimidazoline decarboxylase [Nonomuraea africana]